MGETKKRPLRLHFDGRLRLEFHGAKVTSDGGLLAYRELDEVLGLTKAAEGFLCDSRTGRNTRHSLTALLRQSAYSRLAGYEDINDAERLCVDPAMRQVVGGRATDHTAASRQTVLSSVQVCEPPCRWRPQAPSGLAQERALWGQDQAHLEGSAAKALCFQETPSFNFTPEVRGMLALPWFGCLSL